MATNITAPPLSNLPVVEPPSTTKQPPPEIVVGIISDGSSSSSNNDLNSKSINIPNTKITPAESAAAAAITTLEKTIATSLISDNDVDVESTIKTPPATTTTTTTLTNTNLDEILAENQYFYEDEVFKFDSNGRVKFGLVIETYEAVTNDTAEDLLSKGEVRVAWHPKGTEEIIEEKFIGLADRTLMPGDIVRRIIPGKDTQKGYCRDVQVSADVNIKGTSYIAKNVSSERLRPLITMLLDNAVCLDSWVGSTKSINERLILKTPCGHILEIRVDEEDSPFTDVDTKHRRGFFAGTLYYPGQTLVGPTNSIDRDVAKWTNSGYAPELRSKKNTTFYVQSVETEGVFVQWQCKALSDKHDANFRESQPKGYVTGDDLKRLRRLNLFESCMLQINDKNYLTIEDGDIKNLTSKSQWRKDTDSLFDSNKQVLNRLKQKYAMEKEKLAAQSIVVGDNATNIEQPKSILSQPQSHHHQQQQQQQQTQLTTPKFIEIDKKQHMSSSKIKLSGSINAKLTPSAVAMYESDTKKHIESTIAKIFRRFDNGHGHNNHYNYNNSGSGQQNSRAACGGGGGGFGSGVGGGGGSTTCALSGAHGEDSDGWRTDDDDDQCCSVDSQTTTVSSCSTSTPRSSPKRSPLLTKKMKKLRKRNDKRLLDRPPKVGDEIVTETVVVYSKATVVWQDGSIEKDISSRELYPIHHLDEHEFFPGDFVLTGIETDDVSYRDYGVIQRVDHIGRTAIVKWFSTYTSASDPVPTFFNESEVSVYDLKDHPDFQYRPGTIVIRVANFCGEDVSCTAGQVVDNYAEGRVKVWWVDGHFSMCWPQDLFEVGHYDADHNFWLSNESDNESWETESECSEPESPQCVLLDNVDETVRPQLTLNLERARLAITHLDEMFLQHPYLENQATMKKLLEVYKKCRFMDRLMNTNFFHEDKFMGLIERVRRVSTTTTRVLDHKNRLFNESPSSQSLSLLAAADIGASGSGGSDCGGGGIGDSDHQALELSQTVLDMLELPIGPPQSILPETLLSPLQTLPQVDEKTAKQNLNKPEFTIEDFGHDNKVDLDDGGGGCVSGGGICISTAATEYINNERKLSTASNGLSSSSTSGVVSATTTESSISLNCSIDQDVFATGCGGGSGGSTVNDKLSKEIQTSRMAGNYCQQKSILSDSGKHSKTVSCDDFPLNNKNILPTPSDIAVGAVAAPVLMSKPSSSTVTVGDDHTSIHSGCSSIGGETTTREELSEFVCARLCALIKIQLATALNEINNRFSQLDKNGMTTTTIHDNCCHKEKKLKTIKTNSIDGDAADYDNVDDIAATAAAADNDNNICNNSIDLNSTMVFPKLNDEIGVLDDRCILNSDFDDDDADQGDGFGNNLNSVASAAGNEKNPSSSSQCKDSDSFVVLESAPMTHTFQSSCSLPQNPQQFYRAVRFDHKLLQTSLPPGVWVRVFEDRIDLLSVMIEGPQNTPYENGMFLFDVQLNKEYPRAPPLCHYLSYCSDRLNPNLYEDGKVCVSLLGTWSGSGSEVWGPSSTLLQVIVSIQGLILVAEPYFNEAGYDRQKGTQQGIENSRMYNEMVILKLVQSMSKLITCPPEVFRDRIEKHFCTYGESMYQRIKGWMELSNDSLLLLNDDNENDDDDYGGGIAKKSIKLHSTPEFSLVPASRGFCLTLIGLLDNFHNKLDTLKRIVSATAEPLTPISPSQRMPTTSEQSTTPPAPSPQISSISATASSTILQMPVSQSQQSPQSLPPSTL